MVSSGATKRHILDTYLKLCTEHGERNVTLKLLVKHVNVSQPCIYYHFHSLSELREIAIAYSITSHFLAGGQKELEYLWDNQTKEELYNMYLQLGGQNNKTPFVYYSANIAGKEDITLFHLNAMIKLQQEGLSDYVFTKECNITKKDEYTLRLLRTAAFNMLFLTLKYYHENFRDKITKEQFARVMTEITYNSFRELWRKVKKGEFDYSFPS